MCSGSGWGDRSGLVGAVPGGRDGASAGRGRPGVHHDPVPTMVAFGDSPVRPVAESSSVPGVRRGVPASPDPVFARQAPAGHRLSDPLGPPPLVPRWARCPTDHHLDLLTPGEIEAAGVEGYGRAGCGVRAADPPHGLDDRWRLGGRMVCELPGRRNRTVSPRRGAPPRAGGMPTESLSRWAPGSSR